MPNVLQGSRIDLVTFDLYDTLVEADPPRWVRYAESAADMGLVVDVDKVRLADRHGEDFYTTENGRLPIRDRSPEDVEQFRIAYTQRYLEALGLAADLETATNVRHRFVERSATGSWTYAVFDDVSPALSLLEKNGVRRAIVSNADRDVTEFCLHMGFARHMDRIVTSALVGWEKPDPRTFHAALDPLGVPAGDALHVGDQALSDVVGARAIGMQAALIDRYARHRDDEHDAIRVTSLIQLAELVVEHNRQSPSTS